MSDIVEKLRRVRGVLKGEWPGPSLMDLEAADEIDRLRETLKLHAGDAMSLTNELDEWRGRALAAEEALALALQDSQP